MAPLTTGYLPPCCHQCWKPNRPLTVLQMLSVGSLSSPDVTTLSGVVFVLGFICTHTSRPQVALYNEQTHARRTSGICSWSRKKEKADFGTGNSLFRLLPPPETAVTGRSSSVAHGFGSQGCTHNCRHKTRAHTSRWDYAVAGNQNSFLLED